MALAALAQGVLAEHALDRLAECLAAVENEQD
jgi:hypothetical protein